MCSRLLVYQWILSKPLQKLTVTGRQTGRRTKPLIGAWATALPKNIDNNSFLISRISLLGFLVENKPEFRCDIVGLVYFDIDSLDWPKIRSKLCKSGPKNCKLPKIALKYCKSALQNTCRQRNEAQSGHEELYMRGGSSFQTFCRCQTKNRHTYFSQAQFS